MIYRVYFPDSGESADDARYVGGCEDGLPWVDDPESAARYAYRKWWEDDTDRSFNVRETIIIIDEDGQETRWAGESEQSVDHHVDRAEGDDANI